MVCIHYRSWSSYPYFTCVDLASVYSCSVVGCQDWCSHKNKTEPPGIFTWGSGRGLRCGDGILGTCVIVHCSLTTWRNHMWSLVILSMVLPLKTLGSGITTLFVYIEVIPPC